MGCLESMTNSTPTSEDLFPGSLLVLTILLVRIWGLFVKVWAGHREASEMEVWRSSWWSHSHQTIGSGVTPYQETERNPQTAGRYEKRSDLQSRQTLARSYVPVPQASSRAPHWLNPARSQKRGLVVRPHGSAPGQVKRRVEGPCRGGPPNT